MERLPGDRARDREDGERPQTEESGSDHSQRYRVGLTDWPLTWTS